VGAQQPPNKVKVTMSTQQSSQHGEASQIVA